MPEFVNEDYVAIAAELIFPNVQSCCALVVSALGMNALGGYHLTLGTTTTELQRATLHLRTEIGGAIDEVFLVGNVLNRPGNAVDGLDRLVDLRTALQAGLSYAFEVKYHDIGANNQGVAVHAGRSAQTNQVTLGVATHGSWVAAPNAVPAAGMVKITEFMAASVDGNTGTKLRITRPTAHGVRACTINAETAITRFNMPALP